MKYCCKELDAIYGRVPGFNCDKGLSQQPEALLKSELFHLYLTKSLKGLQEAIKISYVYNKCLCEFILNLAKSLNIPSKQIIFSKVIGSSQRIF